MIESPNESTIRLYNSAPVRLLVARQAKDSFYKFVEAAWDIVEPARPFAKGWHIEAVCRHLQAVAEGEIKRLLINIPPGHAKSLLVSVLFPAWMWLHRPEWRSLFASYALDLAIRDSVRCRALLESQWYQQVLAVLVDQDPPTKAWELSRDQNTKSQFENSCKGFRISLGVGGKGTGYRGDCIIVDDVLNAKDQFSDAAIEEAIFWWDNVMSSRLNDMATGAKIIIMQRLSERDLAGHVLERGGYDHLCLPTEFDLDLANAPSSIGWTDPRTRAGDLLFPAMFPAHVIAQAKIDLGAAGFAAQHQQRPTPVGGGMLKKYWWRFWQPKGANLRPVQVKLADGSIELRAAVELPADFDVCVQTWDMAFKDTATSDFVVGQVHAAKGADRYILDQMRDRMDFPASLLAVRQLSARWPKALTKLVEDKANGPAVVASLKHEIGGMIEVKPEGGKISRAAAASPQLESGNWYLPHPLLAPWVDAFLAECSAFPAGAHDDQVDAWSQGAKRLLTIKKRKPKQYDGTGFSGTGQAEAWMGT